MKSGSRSKNAFVLFEVLVATALFGSGAVGLAIALNSAGRVAARTQIELRMINKLQSALTEAHKQPQIQEEEFTTDPDIDGVSITTEFIELDELETEEGTILNQMWLVRCTATRTRLNGEEATVAAETFRFLPLYQPR